jgi:hypothetical protein
MPALASKKVDAGEVLLLATAADPGWKEGSSDLVWTNWPLHPAYVPFIDVAVAHLLHGQTQNHNLTAGETLRWYPADLLPRSFALQHPDGTNVRLGLPEKAGNRTVVTATDLTTAGVYRLIASGSGDAVVGGLEQKKLGVPLAVIPDLRESENLESFSDAELDQRLGFTPIHLNAGGATTISASDRLNREWTLWLLMAVFALAICEALLAWWCGRAW